MSKIGKVSNSTPLDYFHNLHLQKIKMKKTFGCKGIVRNEFTTNTPMTTKPQTRAQWMKKNVLDCINAIRSQLASTTSTSPKPQISTRLCLKKKKWKKKANKKQPPQPTTTQPQPPASTKAPQKKKKKTAKTTQRPSQVKVCVGCFPALIVRDLR